MFWSKYTIALGTAKKVDFFLLLFCNF